MALAWTHRHPWLPLAGAGLGLLAIAGLDQALLAAGGLAVPAVVVGTGALLGLPLARAERAAPTDPTRPLGAAVDAMGSLWTTLLAASVAAPLVGLLGWPALLVVALAWATVAFAPSLRALAAGLLVLATLLTGAVVGGWTLAEPGWTLLAPSVARWSGWLGPALVTGLLLAGVGLGHHGHHRRLPLRGVGASVGIGALVATALALRHAAPYEGGALEGLDPLAPVLTLVAVTAGILATGLRPGPTGPRADHVGSASVGLVATALLAGPAAEALPLWWTAVLPVGLAASLGLRAAAGRGLARWTLVAGAVVLVAIPAITRPDLPGPLAAALLGLLPVGVVWVAGSRALLARSA